MNDDRAYTYRVYSGSRNKAVAIVRSAAEVEKAAAVLDEVVVKLFCWRRLIHTYVVSTTQSGYKWRLIEGEN